MELTALRLREDTMPRAHRISRQRRRRPISPSYLLVVTSLSSLMVRFLGLISETIGESCRGIVVSLQGSFFINTDWQNNRTGSTPQGEHGERHNPPWKKKKKCQRWNIFLILSRISPLVRIPLKHPGSIKERLSLLLPGCVTLTSLPVLWRMLVIRGGRLSFWQHPEVFASTCNRSCTSRIVLLLRGIHVQVKHVWLN